jgi:hypothetical protein
MRHGKIAWTKAQDATIRRMRDEGATWDLIAVAVGVSRWCAIERGHLIGARLPPPPEFSPPAEDLARDPFPAGHPETWGAITKGTVLAGVPYEYRAP